MIIGGSNFTIDLETPAGAREYIRLFSHSIGKKVTFVALSSGREVHFDAMTDDDALLVAKLLMDIEMRARPPEVKH